MKTPRIVFYLLGCFFAASALAESPRMNVLFIAADDLRNDLGCYGHPMVKTPNIDRLAARGVLFNRAYCQQALCNPSRASLMTGRRPDTLRIWNLTKRYREDPNAVTTLPQHFKNNGYFAQGIGKLFHNWQKESQDDPESWSVPAQMHLGTHYDDTAKVPEPLPPSLAKSPKCECRDVPDEAYYDGRIASLAVSSLGECAKKEQPFFLGVGFWKPHSPFNAPKKYWDLYKREEITRPEPAGWPEDAPRIAWHNGREISRDFKDNVISRKDAQEIRHGYLANISYLDAQVGRVLDELDRLKLTDKTNVVFWSDHGYHLGEQTLWAKTSNFELDARVPLIIAAPGTSTPARTDALAELLDLYPTLTSLCGLPPVQGTEGSSLVPVLKDAGQSVHEAALTQHPRPSYYKGDPETMGYSVRLAGFRYTEWRDWKTGATVASELYDHQADPQETRNLAKDPTHAERMKQGEAALATFQPLVHPGWKP